MNKVLRLIEQRRANPFVHFDRRELGQLLTLYSRQVAKGVWRDYAIDHGDTTALFHVFRHAGERPLFSIVKKRIKGGLDPIHSYSLHAGPQRLAQGDSLMEIAEHLEKPLMPPRW
ncbi:MAG: DUF2794 domain-containing protein [Rhodospirillum sp.]|nr:DUF2794 domain-containing protein [Rhodospirillum sp.]MCF8488199.1 DUF2794 domain-containing protein [Rhodospirillum sp.]MCF8501372.1 DUF2794 domain-containing protein [Rhodospirillum sp.]